MLLAKLRHYLYAVKEINIFTDHQPLTFAVSESNPNAKIKRWKARIDESGARIFYKPGKNNLVADALSRQQFNVVENQVHSELSLTHTIESTFNKMMKKFTKNFQKWKRGSFRRFP